MPKVQDLHQHLLSMPHSDRKLAIRSLSEQARLAVEAYALHCLHQRLQSLSRPDRELAIRNLSEQIRLNLEAYILSCIRPQHAQSTRNSDDFKADVAAKGPGQNCQQSAGTNHSSHSSQTLLRTGDRVEEIGEEPTRSLAQTQTCGRKFPSLNKTRAEFWL